MATTRGDLWKTALVVVMCPCCEQPDTVRPKDMGTQHECPNCENNFKLPVGVKGRAKRKKK